MEIIIKKTIICLLLLGVVLISACQKDKEMLGTLDIAKINVINTVVSGGNVKANISTKNINWTSIPDNQSLGELNLGKLFIVPTNVPTLLEVVPLVDTTKFWYNRKINLEAGKIYSLYLSGTPITVDTLFKEEINFPKYNLREPARSISVSDSIVAIRFVNLSANGPKVDINIQGKSTTEVSNLEYQQATEFKIYPARRDNYNIVFEIRRSSDKQLISTYSFDSDFFRFQTIAVIIKGIYDPSNFSIPDLDRYSVGVVAYQ